MIRKTGILNFSRDAAHEVRHLVEEAVAAGMSITLIVSPKGAGTWPTLPNADFATLMRRVESEIYTPGAGSGDATPWTFTNTKPTKPLDGSASPYPRVA